MKTIFRSAMVIAAAAALCAGCNKENIEEIIPSADEFVTLDGTASFGGTRVELVGEKSMHWSAGDELAVIEFADGASEYYGTSSSKTPKAPKATLEESGSKAEFTVQLTKNDTAEEFNYYAVYPYAAFYNVTSPQYANLNITLPATQTPTDDFVDPAAAILVGRSVAQSAQGGEVEFNFQHLAAYVKLTVKGVPSESTPETITIASDDTSKKIAGAFYWYYDEETKNSAGSVSATQNTVTVKAEKLTAGSDGEYTVWFTVHPTADLTNFTVTVNCGDEDYVAKYEDDVTIEAGHIFNAEITVAEDESDYSGTYVIAAKDNDGKYHAMSIDNPPTLQNGALAAVDFTYSESVKTDDANIVWTITKDETEYLLYNVGKEKYLSRKSETLSGGADWYEDTSSADTHLTITELGTGIYQISSSAGILQLRSSGPDRFGFYNSANNINKLELIPAEIVVLPKIDVNGETTIQIEGNATSDSFEIEVSDADTTEAKAYNDTEGNAECDWLTVTHTSGSTTVNYSVTDNNTDATRTAYIIVKASNSNGSRRAIVTVKQTNIGGKPEQTFTIKSSTVVSGSGYDKYTKTEAGRDWIITFGGNNASIGTNSTKRSNCTLSSYSKYAVSPVTTSSIAAAFACTTELSNVSKIAYTVGGGSNQANTKVYIIYSEDNTTFKQIELTSGTQGAALSTSGDEFEFKSSTGYFAVLLQATNTSGNWRIDDFDLTFTYTE